MRLGFDQFFFQCNQPRNDHLKEKKKKLIRWKIRFHIVKFICHLFAGEPHKHISHDALPLALEHTLLESVEEFQVLLDEEPERTGERTEDTETETETIWVGDQKWLISDALNIVKKRS